MGCSNRTVTLLCHSCWENVHEFTHSSHAAIVGNRSSSNTRDRSPTSTLPANTSLAPSCICSCCSRAPACASLRIRNDQLSLCSSTVELKHAKTRVGCTGLAMRLAFLKKALPKDSWCV